MVSILIPPTWFLNPPTWFIDSHLSI